MRDTDPIPECPECGSRMLVSFSSMDKRYCGDCELWLTWELKDGQPSVYGDRVGGSTK